MEKGLWEQETFSVHHEESKKGKNNMSENDEIPKKLLS